MAQAQWSLTLLGTWQLRREGHPVGVATRQQRLIAALALRGARSRSYLAGLLWPENSEDQASGSLRACVWHISHELPGLLSFANDQLALDEQVHIDVNDLLACVAGIENSSGQPAPGPTLDLLRNAELLPGWYEDWVLFEQERIQQLGLGALETVAHQALQAKDTLTALKAARAAAALAPLRESAHRLLIKAHLMDGNHAEAVTTYRTFSTKLREEFDVAPSPQLSDLVGGLHSAGGSDALPRRRRNAVDQLNPEPPLL